MAVKKLVRRLIRGLGYDLVAVDPSGRLSGGYPPDFDDQAVALVRAVAPYTMTSPERLFALREAVRYIVACNIPGDVVECGVWRGGSMMAAARTLTDCGQLRTLHLFDTFQGMPPPGEVDRDYRGRQAADQLAAQDKATSYVWAYSSLDEVRRNLHSTGYPADRIRLVPGKVEETLPDQAPEQIALLRLDTDWYESTYHELVHLYPRLSVGGVLIVDDYGHWEGARRAVDQYCRERQLRLLLNRIDYTGRIAVKLDP